MKKSAFLLLVMIAVLVIAQGLKEDAVMQADVVPDAKDSLLIAENNIHKVRAVSETKVYRDDGNDHVYYIDEHDTFLPPVSKPETERVVTWTEYDRKGRIVSTLDSSTASDHYHDLKITTRQFTYSGNKQVGIAVKEWYETESDTGKIVRIRFIENTTWSPRFTLHHTEEEDAGQWNVEVDSTVYNPDGQKRMVYTYNSMRDSFVEEFAYDAKARLKYRRLIMKQSWSPPWEMESTTCSYHDDGSRVEVDSARRFDPDMKAATKRAGDKNAPDYKWRVITAAAATGSVNRYDGQSERTYDASGNLIRFRIGVGYRDDTWVYDENNRLVLQTELCGSVRTDSVWYEYKNGILYHEKVRRFFNNNYTNYDDTFQVDGVPVDPNRSFSFKYEDKEYGIVEVVTRYNHNDIAETMSFNEKGLIIRREAYSFYRDLTVTEYTYFTW